MIEVRGLKKSFNSNPVLRGVDFDVEDGEILVIIGKSGCGKTVLLKHLIGLMRPDGGQIVVDGVEINRAKKSEVLKVRKRFGMLFQSAALFDSLTVQENIALPLREHSSLDKKTVRDRVKDKLRLVGLEDIEHLRPSELSGGMKKRVGLARALILDPSYLLFDEPTTGVDPIMAKRINELIVDLKKRLKVTAIAVTHDLQSAYRIGSRLAMLEEGKIVFIGTADEIRTSTDPKVIEFIEGYG
jgi:phospholipid/cholesterol/gamma-HCH transport system ATP-binding protein